MKGGIIELIEKYKIWQGNYYILMQDYTKKSNYQTRENNKTKFIEISKIIKDLKKVVKNERLYSK